MESLRIAFFPLIRTTFDVPLAEEMIRQARIALRTAGFELIEPEKPINDLAQAQAAARDLLTSEIDLLLIYQATFADSTMVTALVENSDAPIFLWAIPEEWSGGRLRLNSLCGINLAGHALTLRGRKYHYAYASPQDTLVYHNIRAIASAEALRKRLKNARLGVVGEHPDGMDSCHLDEGNLSSIFGIQIQRIPLEQVFERARNMPEASLSETRTALDARLDNLATLEQTPLKGTLSVYHALKSIAEEQKLDGLAVRCWPEFFTVMGCAACGAMSMLTDGFGLPSPMPCSCEADINGTVTQLILQWLAKTPAFGTDMVGVDVEKNRVALWHCGLAPLSMADPSVQPRGEIHSNRKVPLVMSFPLKPGEITIARISQATGKLRLIYGHGHMMAEPKPFSGTAGTLMLDCTAERFLQMLMDEGLEHHVSLTYGDFSQELKVFAELINLPALKLEKMEVK
ncbi:MAG: fucose isomerase [Anaerolineaceae bacterium]|nr:fucose isomerase [Anaerolineaceae bacterium]